MENKLQEIIKLLKSYNNVDVIKRIGNYYEFYITYEGGIRDFLGELSPNCKWKGFDEMDFSEMEIKFIRKYFNDMILWIDDEDYED